MATDLEPVQTDEVILRLAEALPASAFIAQNGVFKFLNQQLLDSVGYTAHEIVGQDCFLPIPVEERMHVRRKTAEQLKGQQTQPFEYHFLTRSGDVRLARQKVVSIEYGGQPAVLGTLFDITQQRADEEKLRLLEWLTREMSNSDGAEAALAKAVQGVCQITGWAMGEVWIGSGERDLSLGAAWWRPDRNLQRFVSQSRRVSFSLRSGLPHLAWAYKRSIWIEDLQSFGGIRGATAAASAGLRGAVATPVLAAGRPIGVLVFYLSEKRSEDARLIEVVSAVAGQLAPVVEKKLVQEALSDNEQRTRLTLDAAFEAFISIDEEGRVVEWNRRAEEIFGWSKKDVLGQRLVETIIPERYRSSHLNGIEHYTRTGEGPVLNKPLRLSALRRNGEEFTVDLTISPVSHSKRVTFSAFLRDVAEWNNSLPQDPTAHESRAAPSAGQDQSEMPAVLQPKVRRQRRTNVA